MPVGGPLGAHCSTGQGARVCQADVTCLRGPLDSETAGVGRAKLGPWGRDRRVDKGAGGSLEPSRLFSGSLCWTWGPPPVGRDFSWAGAVRGGEGPAADRLPRCPGRAVGIRPPPWASGLWKWVSLALRCWQPGGPRGETPGRFISAVRASLRGLEPAGPGSHARSAALFTVGSSPHCVCADTTGRLTQALVHHPRKAPTCWGRLSQKAHLGEKSAPPLELTWVACSVELMCQLF